jgi:hypothetical protein
MTHGWIAAFAMAIALLPAVAQAGPLTLRFDGTADLTVFGGPVSGTFSGSLTWDPDAAWVPVYPQCPYFCPDGSPGAISTTLTIDAVPYTQSISPWSSHLQIAGNGYMQLVLDLLHPVDFNAGPEPDVNLVVLEMFSDPSDYSLFTDNQLPENLQFLPHLNERLILFSDKTGAAVSFNRNVRVVPEPASTTLVLIGLSTWIASRRRRAAAKEARRNRTATEAADRAGR